MIGWLIGFDEIENAALVARWINFIQINNNQTNQSGSGIETWHPFPALNFSFSSSSRQFYSFFCIQSLCWSEMNERRNECGWRKRRNGAGMDSIINYFFLKLLPANCIHSKTAEELETMPSFQRSSLPFFSFFCLLPSLFSLSLIWISFPAN